MEFIECGMHHHQPASFTDHALLWTRIQFPAMPPLPTPTIFATRRRHDLPMAKDGPVPGEKNNAFQEDMTQWTEQHTPALIAECTPQQAGCLLAQMHCQILSSVKNVCARDGNRLCDKRRRLFPRPALQSPRYRAGLDKSSRVFQITQNCTHSMIWSLTHVIA